MSSADPDSRIGTFEQLISIAITNRLKEVHTCLPGFIVSFNASSQLAEVQPAIKRLLIGDRIISIPKLINVPVVLVKAGDFTITLPITAGDECLLFFSERSIDTWIDFGEERKPNDIRMHDYSDCFALPCSTSKPSATTSFSTTDLEIRNLAGDTSIILKEDKNIEVNTPVKVTITAPNTLIDGNLEVTGTTKLDDTLEVDGVSTLNADLGITGTSTATVDHLSAGKSGASHTHGGVTSGGSQTAPPT
ncbi:hypothetical protein IID23_02260 [Patescibacteria group bacterium]|nr:hypothetical protein [Patescibacteria group bacterium]